MRLVAQVGAAELSSSDPGFEKRFQFGPHVIEHRRLRCGNGVDAVFLEPVWPLCNAFEQEWQGQAA